jgi:integrase
MTGYLSYWIGSTGLLPWMKDNGINNLPEFTPDNAGEFLAHLTEKGIGRATQGKYITFFRRLWSIVSPEIECPWKNKRAQGTAGKVKKKPFTMDQQRSIINYTTGEYRSLHIIMAYTGLRLVDACKLRIEDCFFDRGVIELLPQKTKNRGADPMTAKIGIHPTLGFTLRTLLCGRKSGYFLPDMAFNYDRDKSSISKRIQSDIAGATDLCCTIKPEGRSRAVAVYGAHSWRKSLEDSMREGGVHMMVAMQIMGHVDRNSMTQTYSHVSDKEVREAVGNSMPDLLTNERPMEMAG